MTVSPTVATFIILAWFGLLYVMFRNIPSDPHQPRTRTPTDPRYMEFPPMSQKGKKLNMRIVDDGILTGEIIDRATQCEHCHVLTSCVHIKEIVVPYGITPTANLIFYTPRQYPEMHGLVMALKYVGISCGCYARGHRQLARIDANQRSARSRD